MNPRQLTPNRTVQDEMKVMQRLGFSYQQTNSGGHHVFAHPAYGEKIMSSTPRNDTSWRRRHRACLASLMGLTTWQLERLIAGQPLTRTHEKRKRSQHRVPRAKRPLSLLIAAPALAPVPPVAAPVQTPAPGSGEAVSAGCICPVFGNRHGRGLEGRDGVFEYVLGCPVHVESKEGPRAAA